MGCSSSIEANAPHELIVQPTVGKVSNKKKVSFDRVCQLIHLETETSLPVHDLESFLLSIARDAFWLEEKVAQKRRRDFGLN
eukprot:CAMPEP_0114697302 /NCGR_PEP_ID=MMETSP0191-20121206/73636_1 /TAXON_ID=126664 /ORGANISM="Sorites sp." /LENGTH=81 /DNA_ID=CAMNT_0001996237 /DNA_START=67 /DNA_END=312 /DNA_ORIENTATION=-